MYFSIFKNKNLNDKNLIEDTLPLYSLNNPNDSFTNKALINENLLEISKINEQIENIINEELLMLLLEQAQKTESAVLSVQAYMNELDQLVREGFEIINEFFSSIKNLDSCSEKLNENSESMGEIVTHLEVLKNESLQVEEGTSVIIKIVDDIKNLNTSTNLLSLNASIEAARAGESGRGFNIVSHEMRKLSDATKNSVENIKINTEKYVLKIESVIGKIDFCHIMVTEKSSQIINIQEKVGVNINRIFENSQALVNIREKLTEEIKNSKDTYAKISSLSATFDTMSEIAMNLLDLNLTQKLKIDETLNCLENKS